MTVRLALHAMATRFELVLPCDDARDESALRAAGETALEEIAECEQQLSAFRSDSLVSHVNRVGHERSVVLDQDTFALFEECAQVRRASEGALDVCLGNALRVHGFRESNEGELPGRQLASAGFELDPATWSLRLLDSQAALDLGAVGKGHALELAGRSLREGGVERALLHGGTSSVLALGAPPDADAWNVALEAAEDAPRVALCDSALSVSATHGRRNARDQGHVLDPASGEPLEREGLVAVVSPSARTAELWSTALLVRGALPAARTELDALFATGAPGERRYALPVHPHSAFSHSAFSHSAFSQTTTPAIR